MDGSDGEESANKPQGESNKPMVASSDDNGVVITEDVELHESTVIEPTLGVTVEEAGQDDVVDSQEHKRVPSVVEEPADVVEPEIETVFSMRTPLVEPMEDQHEESKEPTTEPEFQEAHTGDTVLEADADDYVSVALWYNVDEKLLRSLDSVVYQSLAQRFNDFGTLKSSNEVLKLSYGQLQHHTRDRERSFTGDREDFEKKITDLQKEILKLEEQNKRSESALTAAKLQVTAEKQNLATLGSQTQQLTEEKKSIYEMLASKQEQLASLNTDIKAITDTNRELRQQAIDAESAKDAINSDLLKERFEKTTLERELELSQQSAGWFEEELSKRSNELAGVRQEKREEVSSLKIELDKAHQEVAVAKASKAHMEQSIESLESSNTKHSLEIKKLQDKLARKEFEYTQELSKKEQMIQVLENSSNDRKKRIESLQQVYDQTSEKVKADEEEYKKQYEALQDILAQRDTRIKDLEETVAEITTTTLGTVDTTDLLGGLADDRDLTLTPSSQKVMKNARLTDLVADTNRMRKDLAREKRARKKAEKELDTIFKELDRRLPLLKSYKDKCTSLEMKQGQFEVMVDNLSKEKSLMRRQLSISNKKVEELQVQVRQLSEYKVDLQRQLATLLSELTLEQQGGAPLSTEEKQYISHLVDGADDADASAADLTDAGRLISERLSTFRNIKDLINKNEQLLIVSRDLGNELEYNETAGEGVLAGAETEALEKSKLAIEKLQSQLQSVKTQLVSVTNSRDMLQNMVETGNGPVQDSDRKAADERIKQLTEQAKQKQDELNELKKTANSTEFELNMRIQSLLSEKSAVSLALAKEQSSVKLLEEKVKTAEYLSNVSRAENSQLKQSALQLQENSGRLELRLQQLNDEFLDTRATQANNEVQVQTLIAEKQLWQSNDARMRAELDKLVEERTRANATIAKLQALDSERQSQYQESLDRMTKEVERLQKQLDSVRGKLEISNEETKRILHSKNADSQSYQQRIDILESELQTAKSSLQLKSNSLAELTKHLAELQSKYDEMNAKRNSSLSSLENSDTTNEGIVALKQELTNTLEDLKLATQSSVQYRQVSEATEAELSSLNETYTQFKASSEEQLASMTKHIDELTEEVTLLKQQKSTLETELTSTQQKYTEQKHQNDDKIRELNAAVSAFEGIKGDYEVRISTLQADVSQKNNKLAAVTTGSSDLSAALQAQKDSEEQLKQQVTSLQSNISKLEGELASANVTLASGNETFEAEKASLEEELSKSKTRVTELDAQNRTLINRLENSPLGLGTSEDGGDLKELLSYMHRENDSLTQQLNYTKSEEKQLRQTVESTQQELLETQTNLAEAKAAAVATDKYTKLLSTMKERSQELSVYKENNKALREEVKTYLERAEQLQKRCESVSAKVDALEKRDLELESQLASKQAELDSAKSQLELYKKQVADGGQAAQESAKLEARYKESHEKLVREFQEKLNTRRAEQKKTVQEKEQLVQKVAELEKNAQESANGKSVNSAELDSSRAESAQLKKQVEELQKQVGDLTKKLVAAETPDPEAEKAREDFQRQVREQEIANYKKKLSAENEAYKQKLDEECVAAKKTLEEESEKRLQQEMEAYKKRIRAPSNARISEVIEQRWKARSAELDSEYAAKVKEVESASGSTGMSEEEKQQMQKQFEEEKNQLRQDVTAAVRKETAFKENILKRQISTLREKLKQYEGTPTNTAASAPGTKRLGDEEGGDDKRPKTN